LEEEFNSLTARLTTLSDPGKAESDPSDSHTQAALTGNTRRALAEVTQALRRMAEGRYGQCEQCGDQIPPERLEVLPHARFCLPCQSAAS
ncbi:MAG: TraR/DksA family transcriptional regulator, partial [Micromonosporaceae bacterium]